MAKKNFYVVRKGKTPGIYNTWDECKAQVEGVSGAEFKGFATIEEADRYFAGETGVTTDAEGAVAYVDGSYNVSTGEYSCGVVFLYQGEETHFSMKGNDEEMAQMRNVAGEIMGARMAMEEAVKREIAVLTIVHDYQGIASWCTGDWKTNKEGTKAYKEYFDSLQNRIVIHFRKVKGHSGDTYNELADKLAKSEIF